MSPLSLHQSCKTFFKKNLSFKKYLPQTLLRRTMLIVVLPSVIALASATFIFFDRHWDVTTRRLSASVAGDIAMALALLDNEPESSGQDAIRDLVEHSIDMRMTCSSEGDLPDPVRTPDPLRAFLKVELRKRLAGQPFSIVMRNTQDAIAINVVRNSGGFCTFEVPRRRLTNPTTAFFVAWMVGSSLGLTVIALLFLRNQIRPIRRLAEAAEALGRGQDAPWFNPSGALEVRQAAKSLIEMHERLRRQIAQRTLMLAGVSHDLRTPLARMRLEVEMMQESDATVSLKKDITSMESMLASYLSFARGEDGELAEDVKLSELLEEVATLVNKTAPFAIIHKTFDRQIIAKIRPQAMRRCVENLLSNAVRHGKNINILLYIEDNSIKIIVDDDGTGIPSDRRDDAFRPFVRLDESRNADTGGTGLGLAIARDIIQIHGGDIRLLESPQGGLRVEVRMPK